MPGKADEILAGTYYANYQKARKQAEEAERRGDPGEAAAAYRQAAEWLRQYAKSASDPQVRTQRLERAVVYDDVASKMDMLAEKIKRRASQPMAQADGVTGEDDYEAEVMTLIEQTNIRWEDIGGLEETKQAIKRAYAMALVRKPDGVKFRNENNILLYGPPGTGKTLLAAATAGSLDVTFFNVKTSNLLSKYFGESTKLINALFTVARRLSPSVIFLDEVESLTPPRGSGESGAERRVVSELLVALDGLENKDSTSFVLTMGATNVPWLMDDAILSRFKQRVYVPLPDDDARKAILEIHLTRRGHRSDVALESLVKRTEGFSGREIEQLCQAAIATMTQRCNPDLLEIADKGQEALREYEIKVSPLTEKDFKVAFTQTHPIATPESQKRYSDWIKRVES